MCAGGPDPASLLRDQVEAIPWKIHASMMDFHLEYKRHSLGFCGQRSESSKHILNCGHTEFAPAIVVSLRSPRGHLRQMAVCSQVAS